MQAEDRAHRIGQKREVLVLVLVSAGTIEQVILDRAQQKKEIDAKVIQVCCCSEMQISSVNRRNSLSAVS